MTTPTQIALMYFVLAAIMLGGALLIWSKSRVARVRRPVWTYLILTFFISMGLLNLWIGIRHL
jgi:hypothetical protein